MMENQRNYILTFGKHKDKSISEILNEDPQYLLWMDKNISSIIINDAIYYEALKRTEEDMGDFPIDYNEIF